MTIYVTCDWCAHDIDDHEEYSAEELNRLGFEEGLEQGRHVIVEQRFSGTDRFGQVGKRSEVRHFHFPECYLAALKLWDDHADWSNAREAGPAGAATPSWTEGGNLADPPAQPGRDRATVDRVQQAWVDRQADMRAKKARQEAGTSTYKIVPDGAYNYLWRADIVTVEELVEHSANELLGVPGIGWKRLDGIKRAVEAAGFRLKREA